ncbi:MAG: tetratricopeptide repeat protein [Bacteroidia bacterium]|nr:tetratricopeptide repeat protein [Bacteroidia bacterium]
MQPKIKFIFFILVAIAACQSPKEKALAHIKSLESNDSAFSNQLMSQLKTAYLDFTKNYPDDEHTPEFMFRAAQRCIVLQQPSEAVILLGTIGEKYSKSPFTEDALFLEAYTYENNLNDTLHARAYYVSFLKKYPKGELAEDARLAIDNLGRSPEDIVAGLVEQD